MLSSEQLISAGKVSPDLARRLSFWAVPVADALMEDAASRQDTLVVALAGTPSSSTAVFAAFLVDALSELGLPTVHLGLADFELSRHARQRLSASVHPLFEYPSQPGTHDTQEFVRLLKILKAGKFSKTVHLPSFDPIFDVRLPFAKWTTVKDPPKIILVSGWLLGCVAEERTALEKPINALEAEQDSEGVWRSAVNNFIRRDYQPMYELFDKWVYFKPPSYETVAGWIKGNKAEWLREAKEKGAPVQSAFGRWSDDYPFLAERTLRNTLRALPAQCDYLMTWDESRRISSFNRQRST